MRKTSSVAASANALGSAAIAAAPPLSDGTLTLVLASPRATRRPEGHARYVKLDAPLPSNGDRRPSGSLPVHSRTRPRRRPVGIADGPSKRVRRRPPAAVIGPGAAIELARLRASNSNQSSRSE